jgi:cell division ATPase FtsA
LGIAEKELGKAMNNTETRSNTVQVATWFGRPIQDLSHEELLKVVEHCGEEILKLTSDRDRWRQSGDPVKYLMAGLNNKT